MVINFPADCNNTGMYHAYGYQNPQAQQVQYAQNQYAQQQYAQQQQQQYSQQLQQQYAQQQQQQQQQQQYTQQQYAQQQYAQQQQAQQQYAQHQYAQHQYAQHQYAPQIQCQPETYAASEGLRFAPLQPATQPQMEDMDTSPAIHSTSIGGIKSNLRTIWPPATSRSILQRNLYFTLVSGAVGDTDCSIRGFRWLFSCACEGSSWTPGGQANHRESIEALTKRKVFILNEAFNGYHSPKLRASKKTGVIPHQTSGKQQHIKTVKKDSASLTAQTTKDFGARTDTVTRTQTREYTMDR
ncbi:hypothetical protein FPQ18DRAFT_311243 [Pyronema domesticum]|nr:hypothetical protein FPQ18DRAFT_311243 [Pyronema domesticum]